MRKILFSGIFIALSIICFAQNNDCDFSQETIDYVDQGLEYDSISNATSYSYGQIDYKIKAINSFYKAKENNPRCETILQQLSNWLVECGLLEKDAEYYADALRDFEHSIDVSNELLYLTTDGNIRRETLFLISKAETYLIQVQELQEAKQIAEDDLDAAKTTITDAEDDLKDTSAFMTIGTGLGINYIMGGANISIYMHPNGLILAGAIGYAGGWNFSCGYSFGVYKYNGHFKFLYGKDKTKQPVGYMGLGCNLDIIGNYIGLNADAGMGSNLNSFSGETSFMGSVGIYVKF
ncbi:MAG: hypothetical protein LBS54_00890 [Dysgonamonadaceae bacterium]|jgi:tetratricopeptide (TPR) repeat protein|nr:hypothetical protein [Dysgonamonadaceae bacterium]